MTLPDVFGGDGHNGLVAACYLARAGREVLVLEALDRPGGGSRTEETVAGHRFDLRSVAHNLFGRRGSAPASPGWPPAPPPCSATPGGAGFLPPIPRG